MNIQDSNVFIQTTKKLYDKVLEKKENKGLNGNPHFNALDVELSKSDFNEAEWEFLVDNESKFNTSLEINGEYRTFPVYEIVNENLFTNEINIKLIGTKYKE